MRYFAREPRGVVKQRHPFRMGQRQPITAKRPSGFDEVAILPGLNPKGDVARVLTVETSENATD